MEPKPSFKVRIKHNYSTNDGDKYGEWIRSIDGTLNLLRRRPNDFRNYRVPSKLRAQNPEAYTPQMVSIGPYHRNKPELQAMEELKWRYMLSFVDHIIEADMGNTQMNESHGESSESSPQILALEKCCKVISELETEARAFYSEDINLDKHQLVEMLLVDGCFILQYQRGLSTQGLFITETTPTSSPVSNFTMAQTLQQDLLLLENQIPYTVLQKLFDVTPSSWRISDDSGELSLQQFVFSLFHGLPMLYYNILPLGKPIQDATFSHLLDMVYQISSQNSQISPFKGGERLWGFKSCATELIQSGVQISLHDDRVSIVDIKFNEGELLIPNIIFNKTSVVLLRNLIALEQTRIGRQVVISYIRLMFTLVRSPLDIYVLERAGIILNPKALLDVTDCLKELSLEVNVVDFVFRDLRDEVDNYKVAVWRWRRVKGYTTIVWYRWKDSMKSLKKDYFKNRWSFITFLAAFFVILLTFAQTFYTIRAYYPPYH